MPPLPGDRVFHFIQGQVKLLDHLLVAVSITKAPGVQEVIGRLPHGLSKSTI